MNRNNGREIAERLHLLRDYFIKHADRTHAVSMADLQRHLSNKGFIGGNGVALDKKTIYRDLDTLKMLFDMDIEYVEKYKGYVLLNPPFEDYELRLLVDGVQGSKFITQAEARKLTEKIQEHFGKGKGYSLNRPAYVSHRVRSMNDAVVKDADKLYQAIDADRMVGFQYFHMRPNRKKEYSNKGQQIIVSPYALYWNNGNLYLYAYDGRKFRYYRVDRMERIRELNAWATENCMPDLTVYLRMEPHEALARRLNTSVPDRLERESDSFFHRTFETYEKLYQGRDGWRVVTVDASSSIEAVTEEMLLRVRQRLMDLAMMDREQTGIRK